MVTKVQGPIVDTSSSTKQLPAINLDRIGEPSLQINSLTTKTLKFQALESKLRCRSREALEMSFR